MPKLSSVRRPSPALVLALIALFVAMAGGAYAAAKLPKNSVGAKQIKDGSVTGTEVKDGSLGAGEFGGVLPQGPQGPVGPTGPAGPDGVGPATGIFRDGTATISSQTAATPSTIATLSNLPAGAYAITAKTVVDLGGPMSITCRLLAPSTGGGDVDESTVGGDPANQSVLSMQLLHTIPSGTQNVSVACFKNNGTAASASQTKIQAIRLSTVSGNNAVVG